MAVAFLYCSCVHPFQDRAYGSGKRVHTPKAQHDQWKCTVCGKVRTGTGAEVSTTKKGKK